MLQDLIHMNTGICSAIFAVSLLLVSSFLIGRLLLPVKFRLPGKNIISMVVGLDVITVIAYLLGLCGFLSKTTVLCSLLFVSAGSAVFLYQRKGFSLKGWKWTSLKRYILLLLPLAILPIVFGRAICIPTGWDELTYQLAVPERWIQSGNLAVFSDNPYSAFPAAASINFHMLMMAGGLLAPRLLVLSLWVICTLSLYLLLRPGFSRLNASSLTFGFASSFTVLMASTSTYVEFFILLQVAGILLLSRKLAKSSSPAALMAIAGFMAGMAGSVKLTGPIVGIGFLIYVIVSAKGMKKIRPPAILAYLSVFLIVLGIFYARPYLHTGNPASPYLAGLFSSNDSAIEMSRYHHLIGSVKYGIQDFSGFVSAPFLLAVSGSTFDGGFGWQFAVILVLCLFSIIIAWKNSNSRLAALLLMALVFYAFWFFTSQQSRFIIPAVFVLFIASKQSFRLLPQTASGALIVLIVLLTILSIPMNILRDSLISWKTALGIIKTEDYLYSATGPGYLKAVYIANNKLPPDAKLMLIFENRGLYINRKYVIGTPFFQEKFFTPPEKTASSTDLLKTLRDNQISHLLIGLSENDPDRIASYVDRSANFAKLLGSLIQEGKLKTVWQDEGFGIYEVKND